MKPAFEEVYEANFRYIYNYLYAQTLHRETAEDLTMDVFVRALEHYDAYDPSRAAVRTWLVVIARNLLINHRKIAQFRRTESLEDVAEPCREDDYGLRQEAINEAVEWIFAQIAPVERELLVMRYMLEMDNRTIGGLLGAREKTVSQRIVRLLQKCRKLSERATEGDGRHSLDRPAPRGMRELLEDD